MIFIFTRENGLRSKNSGIVQFLQRDDIRLKRKIRGELRIFKPEDFNILDYVERQFDANTAKLTSLPIREERIPRFEIPKEIKDFLVENNLTNLLPGENRDLSEILPNNIVMEHLTTSEMEDLMNTVKQLQQNLTNKLNSQKEMEAEMMQRQIYQDAETEKIQNERREIERQMAQLNLQNENVEKRLEDVISKEQEQAIEKRALKEFELKIQDQYDQLVQRIEDDQRKTSVPFDQ